jgi:Family of unknown function (DUF6345)
MRRSRLLLVSALVLIVAAAAGADGLRATTNDDDAGNASIWLVTKSGLTQDEAGRLAEAFGVPRALGDDGAFRYVSPSYGDVPTIPATGRAAAAVEPGRDEDERETTAAAPDLDALRRLVPISGDEATRRTAAGLDRAGLAPPGSATADVLHSELTLLLPGDPQGSFMRQIDTSVRYRVDLDGVPLDGPGARMRVTYAPGGEVTELRWATRELERGPSVKLLPPGQARHECASHYPEGSKIRTPRLVYWAPPLDERVQAIYPHWECNGTGPQGEALVLALIPAIRILLPVTIDADVDGKQVTATAHVHSGTPPFKYRWASMTTGLGANDHGSAISYQVAPRVATSTEELWVSVTDANGIVTQASTTLQLPFPVQPVSPVDTPGVAVGGEFNVYKWGCVQESSAGFRDVFTGAGVPIDFRWNGPNAWERDFRQTGAPTNGDDASFVDDVDLAWYTGHGGPGAFTFDNPAHDDGSIVPADARYGDFDVEWLQLESCQVLASPSSGGTNAVDRWGGVFDGLHMLNGFHTNASCRNNTAGTFAAYLVGSPALKIRQAWAQMAFDLEPSGVSFVSIGPIRTGDFVWNFDDYFWGKGTVGPDIPAAQSVGLWWLKSTV